MSFYNFHRFLPLGRLSVRALVSSGGSVSGGNTGSQGGTTLLIPLTTRLLIGASGQSNIAGWDSLPPFHTTAIDNSHLFSGSAGTLIIALSESVWGTGQGETPLSALAQKLFDIEPGGAGRSIIANKWAQPSTVINQFVSGSANYTTGINNISSSISASINTLGTASVVCGGLLWVHGETDSQNNQSSSVYLASMSLIQSRYQTDVQARTGQSLSVPLLYSQQHNFHTQPLFTGSASRANTDISYASASTHYLVCPTYMLPFSGNGSVANFHFDLTGSMVLGEYFAKVINRSVIYNQTYLPLRPQSITAVGARITIAVEGGDTSSSLSIDTSSVITKPFYGFRYYDGANPSSSAHIRSVSVSERNIFIDLTQTASATGRVQYAYTGIPQTPSGRKTYYSVGGNIRDNDNAFTSSYANFGPLYNWLISFDRPITSYTAGTSSYNQITGSSVVLDGTQFLTCYDTRNLFSSATALTIALQYASAQTAGEIIGINQTNHRSWIIRTVAGNQIRFNVPSSLNSTADNVLSTTVFGGGRNLVRAVTCVFDGAGILNAERAQIYSGSTLDALATYNGSIPSALTNQAKHALEIGASGGGGSRFSGSLGVVAIWVGQAATALQVAEIFPSASLGNNSIRGDLENTSLGAPTLWFKWQGDAYNSGSYGAHAYHFQTGVFGGASVANNLTFSSSLGVV